MTVCSFQTISPEKRACVQQTITVYRLARNGFGEINHNFREADFRPGISES